MNFFFCLANKFQFYALLWIWVSKNRICGIINADSNFSWRFWYFKCVGVENALGVLFQFKLTHKMVFRLHHKSATTIFDNDHKHPEVNTTDLKERQITNQLNSVINTCLEAINTEQQQEKKRKITSHSENQLIEPSLISHINNSNIHLTETRKKKGKEKNCVYFLIKEKEKSPL